MDPIDRVSVLKAIDEYERLSTMSQTVRNMVTLRGVVQRLPSVRPEPRWVPCSEGFPKVREWVLCQCRAGIMDVFQLTEDGYWNRCHPQTEYVGGFVIAWMPLPTPWEGGGRSHE